MFNELQFIGHGIVGCLVADIDYAYKHFAQFLVSDITDGVEHLIVEGAKGLGYNVNFPDGDLFLPHLAFLSYLYVVLAAQFPAPFFAVIGIIAGGEAGDKIKFLIFPLEQEADGREQQYFCIGVDGPVLLQGTGGKFTLTNCQLADEIVLAVDINLQVFQGLIVFAEGREIVELPAPADDAGKADALLTRQQFDKTVSDIYSNVFGGTAPGFFPFRTGSIHLVPGW